MNDPVNHPAHYIGNGLEAIEVIEAFGLGFNLGNTIKYILRAGRKGARKIDLEKAEWYLLREIRNLENASADQSPHKPSEERTRPQRQETPPSASQHPARADY